MVVRAINSTDAKFLTVQLQLETEDVVLRVLVDCVN
jgi:hypothetical protein